LSNYSVVDTSTFEK